jgi:hypothetical protein
MSFFTLGFSTSSGTARLRTARRRAPAVTPRRQHATTAHTRARTLQQLVYALAHSAVQVRLRGLDVVVHVQPEVREHSRDQFDLGGCVHVLTQHGCTSTTVTATGGVTRRHKGVLGGDGARHVLNVTKPAKLCVTEMGGAPSP